MSNFDDRKYSYISQLEPIMENPHDNYLMPNPQPGGEAVGSSFLSRSQQSFFRSSRRHSSVQSSFLHDISQINPAFEFQLPQTSSKNPMANLNNISAIGGVEPQGALTSRPYSTQSPFPAIDIKDLKKKNGSLVQALKSLKKQESKPLTDRGYGGGGPVEKRGLQRQNSQVQNYVKNAAQFTAPRVVGLSHLTSFTDQAGPVRNNSAHPAGSQYQGQNYLQQPQNNSAHQTPARPNSTRGGGALSEEDRQMLRKNKSVNLINFFKTKKESLHATPQHAHRRIFSASSHFQNGSISTQPQEIQDSSPITRTNYQSLQRIAQGGGRTGKFSDYNQIGVIEIIKNKCSTIYPERDELFFHY